VRAIFTPLRRFARRYPGVGPVVWIVGISQYFWAQWYVANAWPTPFSLRLNVISDLGSTSCGIRDAVYVCSPLHAVMNWSLIIVGPTLAIGAALIYANFKPSRISKLAFILLALSGLCTSLVGAIPEDISPVTHMLIATTCLIVYTIGVTLVHHIHELPAWLRRLSLEVGGLSVAALLILAVRLPTPLGPGGLERLAGYSLDLWVCIFAIWLLAPHLRSLSWPSKAHRLKKHHKRFFQG
jgi:hypothetical membrane protein